MIHANQIKIAFANMMRMAARDPLWAIVALITFPLRYAKSFVMGAAGYLFVVFTVYFGIDYLRRVILGGHRGDVIWHIGDWVVMAFAILLLIRLLSTPLITHFGSAVDDTHGSARFAGLREIAPLTKAEGGLLIGRANNSGRLLRYSGPAHLLTMAPTRSGKGVGTIIPNLLTADRSIICIDPKGDNAIIAGDAREKFGPVHILDPFGITGRPTAAFNPMDGVDKDSVDVAEDATTLADALVFDEPGLSGDAHWNEEAKALIAGLLLHVLASQPGDRRTLTTLRHLLTMAPAAFQNLLHEMQGTGAINGLVARAANRHLGKSDREASGVLSAAQRHTHFLDSPRMTGVLGRSDFRFGDLKADKATVFLVLPPDRLAAYSRWLRLLVAQSLTEMARTAPSPHPSMPPVLYLLDEFAALGHLAPIERAMGLMAGYGVQLWPIIQDIHQLRATYGQRAGTFLSNAGVLQVFGVNDHDSARLVSDLLGQETVVFNTAARALDSERTGLSFAEQHVGRPLLTPDEVRNMHAETELLFIAGQRPIVATKLRYYADPEFAGLFTASQI
ncbi:type IV secretory system conjugative DNA transfer family protein [Rhizobium ruizarguesonis]|uniref:Type IV secretory system conjugative DNA transfer family protein n=3 Tax=Rhizobium ruizarguesonis TaxID=2081791 RepID=A0ABY1WW38_9HYPH|nr:type IV secretory system conjugative DNA transfer family protein [Rhizobium ruizarguesonis]TAU57140.1 type IV secretory system conjugative DNA transfer family protein [Rhizobium ruizarguesonis]TAV19745.1 type IV secretory system conjugative DNA transfer family protein [Rhizobium ruizarguesonis]TAV33556.1 type IV secretory system conjugative DNA transfer family protein [Rhizobium ruizarguesonis]TAX62853.1 type IV secretory system conjugative DNA transfer family protein [Rhizobium ruizargueson